MTRIATAAILAIATLGAAGVNAASLPAGAMMGARDLTEKHLGAADAVQVTTGTTVQIRAGDVLSQRELTEAGLRADSLVSVSAFPSAGAPTRTLSER